MKLNKKIILIGAFVIGFILSMIFIIPIINEKIELRGIRNQIQEYEQQKYQLSGEINQLSMEWQKCKTLQNTTAEQAEGKRGAISVLDDKIKALKIEYNTIVGFTQG